MVDLGIELSVGMLSISHYELFYSKYDLYTKSDAVPDIEKLWPYYEKLIDKYIPGVIEW